MGMSPLTEGRGLKRLAVEESMFNPMVAPHGGAWIETEDVAKECEERLVAPHGGAWIETGCWAFSRSVSGRRPSRRGVD